MAVTRIILVHTNSTDNIHAVDDLSKHNLYKNVNRKATDAGKKAYMASIKPASDNSCDELQKKYALLSLTC